MSKKTQIEGLEAHVIVEAFIYCSGCPENKYFNELDPEQDAYIHGWRVDGDEVYCPTCVRINKSEKKKK